MRRLAYGLLLALFYGLSAQRISFRRSPDIGRFLRDGELIGAGQTAVLHQNFYSYTNPTFEFPNHHWLAAVAAHTVSNAAGFEALNLLWITLAAGAFFLYLKLAERESGPLPAAIFAGAMLPLMASRQGIRPENLSLLLSAAFFYILWRDYRGTSSKRWLWVLPLLEAFWVNLHPGFAIGLVFTGAFLVAELFRVLKKEEPAGSSKLLQLAAVLGLSCAAGLANPNGLKGLLFPFTVSNNYAMDVRENLSMFAIDDMPIAPLTIAVAALLGGVWLIAVRKKVKIDVPLLILSVGLAGMSLAFYRIYVFAGGPILMALCVNFSRLRALKIVAQKPASKKRPRDPEEAEKTYQFALWCAGAVAVVGIAFFLDTRWANAGLGVEPAEETLASFLQANQISGRVFNGYGSGGYLIHFLPDQKVYFDSRPEAYPGTFVLEDYKQALADEGAWNRVLRKYDFDYICFVQFNKDESDFLLRRVRDPEWSVVRAGMEMVLVRNKPQFAEVIRKYKLRF